MAGLDRNLNMEAKYLKKVLSRVDERIDVPASLRGDVLRQKIENIEPAPEPVTTATLLKPRRWLTWQSGLTYAAGFVLLVGLFYGLGFNNSGTVLEGGIDLPQNQAAGVERAVDEAAIAEDIVFDDDVAEPFAADVEVYTGGDAPDSGGPATGGAPATGGGETATPDSSPEPSSGAADSDLHGVAPAAGAAPQVFLEPGAANSVGGENPDSVLLGLMNGFTLTYRDNDGSASDKQSYPLTVEVLSVASDRIVSRYDLALSSISYHCSLDDTLAVVGGMNGDVGIYTLRMGDTGELSLISQQEQRGRYVSARLHNDYLHVASYAVDIEGYPHETEELPEHLNDTACVLTAINLHTATAVQKAFVGASENIRLHNISVFVSYDAVEEAGREAHITLEGAEMRVNSVA